jgi:hypothetical protein
MARMVRAASVVIFAGLISVASAAESSAQADALIEAAKQAMGGSACRRWHWPRRRGRDRERERQECQGRGSSRSA